MTKMQLELIIIVLVLLTPVIALGSYAYGWWWRGRSDRRIYGERFTRTSRPMTPDEQAAFSEGFEHMDRAFESFRTMFGK